jgi:hypothetical protein
MTTTKKKSKSTKSTTKRASRAKPKTAPTTATSTAPTNYTPRLDMLPAEPVIALRGAPRPGKPGRPASEFPERAQLRHSDEQEAAWRRAAAASMLEFQDWIRNVLDVASGRMEARGA